MQSFLTYQLIIIFFIKKAKTWLILSSLVGIVNCDWYSNPFTELTSDHVGTSNKKIGVFKVWIEFGLTGPERGERGRNLCAII